MSDGAMTDPKLKHRYDMPLLDAILDLHMICTGASRSVPDINRLVAFLEMRAANWNRSDNMPWAPFDAVVFALLQTALIEWKWENRK